MIALGLKHTDFGGTYTLRLNYLISSILLIPSLVYNILMAEPCYVLLNIYIF